MHVFNGWISKIPRTRYSWKVDDRYMVILRLLQTTAKLIPGSFTQAPGWQKTNDRAASLGQVTRKSMWKWWANVWTNNIDLPGQHHLIMTEVTSLYQLLKGNNLTKQKKEINKFRLTSLAGGGLYLSVCHLPNKSIVTESRSWIGWFYKRTTSNFYSRGSVTWKWLSRQEIMVKLVLPKTRRFNFIRPLIGRSSQNMIGRSSQNISLDKKFCNIFFVSPLR